MPEGEKSEISSAQRIERLIDEARGIRSRVKALNELAGRQAEQKTGVTGLDRDQEVDESALKAEILNTLAETEDELSGIIGLLSEKETLSRGPRTSPKYCCFCRRGLLPNSRYCDRCGAYLGELGV